MTNKVTVQKLFDFEKEALRWLNFSPDNGKSFPNFDSPLGECVKKVMPAVKMGLQRLDAASKEFNFQMEILKCEHASSVKIVQNEGQSIKEYMFEPGTKKAEYEKARKKAFEDYIPSDDKLRAEEVELEVCYLTRPRPTAAILPQYVHDIMVGITIDPEQVNEGKIAFLNV